MNISKEKYWIGGGCLLAGFVLGAIALNKSSPNIELMTPAADAKTEQNYRRAGLGDRLMNGERRRMFSDCYKSMLRNSGFDETNPTPKPGSELEGKDSFEGKVTIIFHISENGTMLSHELVESEIPDKAFQRCVYNAIKGTRFMPPPLGINRYIAYDLMFRSDESFRKEMEEKRNQAPLALVTATPGAQGTPATNTAPAQPGQQPPPPPPPPPSMPRPENKKK